MAALAALVLALAALVLRSVAALHCDYAHIDAQHTMCVFAPRMCAQKKLLREFSLVLSTKYNYVVTRYLYLCIFDKTI